jgi:hypothetical protein
MSRIGTGQYGMPRGLRSARRESERCTIGSDGDDRARSVRDTE